MGWRDVNYLETSLDDREHNHVNWMFEMFNWLLDPSRSAGDGLLFHAPQFISMMIVSVIDSSLN